MAGGEPGEAHGCCEEDGTERRTRVCNHNASGVARHLIGTPREVAYLGVLAPQRCHYNGVKRGDLRWERPT